MQWGNIALSTWVIKWKSLYNTQDHLLLLIREAIRTTKIAQVIVTALGCQQEPENKTLLLKTLHTLVRDIDKSISNSSGNSLPAGWLSWCKKVLWRMQRKKRLQGCYPVPDPTGKILNTSRICQLRSTHLGVGAWQVWGNQLFSDWIWDLFHNRDFMPNFVFKSPWLGRSDV